jgi:hypothetical protein
MTEYTYKTYGMARFHVPEGMYSIEEFEEMLANIKEAKRHQDEQLKAAMRPKGKKHMNTEAYDWDIERCRAYAEQLRDKTRANTAEHAAQAIEWLLAQLASHQIIGKKREWVGLRDEDEIPWDGVDAKSFAKAIEAKLKEKNT